MTRKEQLENELDEMKGFIDAHKDQLSQENGESLVTHPESEIKDERDLMADEKSELLTVERRAHEERKVENDLGKEEKINM